MAAGPQAVGPGGAGPGGTAPALPPTLPGGRYPLFPSLLSPPAPPAAVGSGPGATGAAPLGAAPQPPSDLAALIDRAALAHGLPPRLLAALVQEESGFDPNARSRAGAMGLTQLMPATAAALGVSDPWNPAENLDAGAAYLAGLIDRYGGNVPLALAAYNAGPGAVAEWGGIPPYPETQRYVRNVLALAGMAQT
ncbi:MAG: lytic transglycosylase domain-containing protein [Firmicutes bacterium]|nr:lytic transglycosylase domain-containing protein [Bacillota bacterium]